MHRTHTSSSRLLEKSGRSGNGNAGSHLSRGAVPLLLAEICKVHQVLHEVLHEALRTFLLWLLLICLLLPHSLPILLPLLPSTCTGLPLHGCNCLVQRCTACRRRSTHVLCTSFAGSCRGHANSLLRHRLPLRRPCHDLTVSQCAQLQGHSLQVVWQQQHCAAGKAGAAAPQVQVQQEGDAGAGKAGGQEHGGLRREWELFKKVSKQDAAIALAACSGSTACSKAWQALRREPPVAGKAGT